MDRFMEMVVTKHQKGLNEVLYYLSAVVMVISAIIAMMLLNVIFYGFSVPLLVLLVVNAALAVYLFLFRDRLRTEYEYTFTNGALDFAQVYNNKKRKNLGSLNCKTVDAFGPVEGKAFARYSSMPGMKHTRWFLNRGAKLYYFYFQKEGNKRLIVLEPNEQLVEYIRFYLPHGAYQD